MNRYQIAVCLFFQCCFVLKKKLEIERDVLNAHRSICCYCILLTFWHYSTSRMHRQAAEDDVVSHDATNQTHIDMLSHGAVKGVKSILFLGWTFFYLFLWCGLFYLEFFNILFSSILIQLKAVKLKWSSSWFYYFDQNKIYLNKIGENRFCFSTQKIRITLCFMNVKLPLFHSIRARYSLRMISRKLSFNWNDTEIMIHNITSETLSHTDTRFSKTFSSLCSTFSGTYLKGSEHIKE